MKTRGNLRCLTTLGLVTTIVLMVMGGHVSACPAGMSASKLCGTSCGCCSSDTQKSLKADRPTKLDRESSQGIVINPVDSSSDGCECCPAEPALPLTKPSIGPEQSGSDPQRSPSNSIEDSSYRPSSGRLSLPHPSPPRTSLYLRLERLLF
jgi:hypothetical protein